MTKASESKTSIAPPNINEALHTMKVYRAFSIRLHSRRKATTYPQY